MQALTAKHKAAEEQLEATRTELAEARARVKEGEKVRKMCMCRLGD